MNENEVIKQYEHLIPITLTKLFGDYEKFAKSKHLSVDDLFQYGRLGIWNSIRKYPEKRIGTFQNFTIRNIRWSVKAMVERTHLNKSHYKSNRQKNGLNHTVALISMSHQPYDDSEMDFYDTVAVDNIVNFDTDVVESKLVSNESYKSIWSLLSDREKEMVTMKANGMSYTQIGEVYGVKKQAIGHRFTRLQDKVKRHMGVVQ